MSKRKVTLVAGTAIIVTLLGVAGIRLARGGQQTGTDASVPASVPAVTGPAEGEIELQLTVDEDLAPALSHVGALDDGGLDRPVGRIKYDDDTTADLVLGELIVAVESDDELKGFLERNQGLVLDSFPGEEGQLDEYLVRIPVRDADPAVAARALTEAEEGHTGEYAVSDSQLLAMMLVAAEEKLEFGIDVALNWISTVAGIADGKVEDAFDQKNPFDWGYLKVGGPVDSGVSGAWQLIDYYQKDDAEVRILIADGGFFENPDFPFQREIRLGKWNTKNPGSCTGGAACPWHGTSVAVTAMGQIDNGYGTAGVAGQVGIMIAVQKHGDFWTELRQIKKVVDEERPAVVNMSFGWEVKTFRAASESSTDRHLKAMKSDGALVFASAGNEGKDIDSKVCIGKHCYENRLTIPCESRYAICVGGYDGNGWLHTSSNYGPSGGGRSVQIYAPYCVIAPYNPVNNGIKDTKWTCGTSFSSPFVAGAAALVKAADPSLGPDQIWEIIRSTANVGGVQFDHLIPTHNQLRVNVMDAVAKALGVQQTAPVVEISAPANGFETGITDWFDLEGSAIDFKGQPLEITWESSIDGVLGTGLDAQAFFEPSAGTHTITATATDVNGKSGSASITVQVVDLPPEMTISWPASGSLVYETEDLNLIGLSEDPDTYSNLPDEDVEWKVVRNGQVKYAASGHIAEVPGGTLTPGHYEVVFTGQDGGGESEAVVNIAVLEVVGHVPSVLITSNLKESYGYSGGSGVELTLTGFASDFEDGTLPGTSFRWLLTTDGGAYQEEICRGSTFHGADDPGDGAFNPGLVLTPPAGPALPPVFGTKKDCSEVTINLGLAPGHVGETQWAIVLEASDSDHQPGSDVADVRITFAVG